MINKFLSQLVNKISKVDIDHLVIVFVSLYVLVALIVSYFSNGLPDEYLYWFETTTITDLLRHGVWIGSDFTGTHGFLFKMPVALLFIVFGKSLFVARAFNVLLLGLFMILLYHFAIGFLKSKKWAFLFLLLVTTSYQFLRVAPTYLRDIPSLLALVFFLHYFYNNRRLDLRHGLLLLLVLDAKEYVAVILAAAVVLYTLITFITTSQKFKEFISQNLLLLLPSLIYVVLMLYTRVIPYNDMLAKSLYIRGNAGASRQITSLVSAQTPVLRNIEVGEYSLGQSFGLSLEIRPNNIFHSKLRNVFGEFLLWDVVSKFNSSRVFTLTSVPKIILLIALAAIFKKNRGESKNYSFYSIFFITYLVVYLVKTSLERYMLHITPVLFLYFVLELKNVKTSSERIFARKLLLVSLCLTIFGFIFDNFILLPKIFANFLLFTTLYFYFSDRMKEIYRKVLLSFGFILYSCFIVLMWSYSTIILGPIHQFLNYGRDFEYKTVSMYIEDDSAYWYNGNLYFLYGIGNKKLTPPIDRLRYNFRKKTIVNEYDDWIVSFKPSVDFTEKLTGLNIKKLIYLRSNGRGYSFPYEMEIDQMIKEGSLTIISRYDMINKTLFLLRM